MAKDRKKILAAAAQNYVDIIKMSNKADRLLLELISHPDATDDQILSAAKMRGRNRSKNKEVYNQLVELCHKEGVPQFRINALPKP